MPEGNVNGVFSTQPLQSENNRGGCGGFGFCGCDSEILFFIIIFLLLFTNFGCGCSN